MRRFRFEDQVATVCRCRQVVVVLTIAGVFISFGFGQQVSSKIDPAKLTMFAPLPDVPTKIGAATKDQIDLGRMLFYETRLSKSQTISCNSCHVLDKYGVDNQPTSTGYKGQKGDRN